LSADSQHAAQRFGAWLKGGMHMNKSSMAFPLERKKTLQILKFATLVALLVSFTIFALGCGGDGDVLTVGDVSHDPFAFQGEIVVSGLVTHFTLDNDRIFGVKDLDEMRQCGFNVECGAWIMPVLYIGQGEIPQLGDEVNLTGHFTYVEDDLVFQVTEYSVVGNFAAQLN